MPGMSSQLPTVIEWTGQAVRLLDQTRLPVEETYLEVRDLATLIDAIKRLVVRGAPAIGCAGAYGVLLAAREAAASSDNISPAWRAEFDKRCQALADARPTAVNLSWAVARVKQAALNAAKPGVALSAVFNAALLEAHALHEEDRRMCAEIGRHGATLLPKNKATVLTHCNAGALATGGSGTALAVIYAAQHAGVQVSVYADETRPLLQGARLTAWELARSGVDVTVICDNMAAAVMRARKPDAVIVGADRIAANGDTANKIGTYGLAVLAKHHGIPFYVAAPSSTFDLRLSDGSQIPIEERSRDEIARPSGVQSVPNDARVFNPAFDVTPADLIAALITEKGVLRAPFVASIRQALA